MYRVGTFLAADGKRNNRVGERAHEDFRRVHGANKCDIDVAIPFQAGRDADALDTVGGRGSEPVVSVDTFAFNGNQAGAGVRCGDLQLDGFTRRKIGFGEFDLQLRVLFQRTRQICLADHAEFDAVEFGIIGPAHDQRVVTGLSGWERVRQPLGRDGKGLLAAGDFLSHRLVLVSAV